MKIQTYVAAALIAAGAIAPANAAQYLITYTGKVAGGTDSLGLFGAPGGDLTGSSFSVAFVLTDPKAGATIGNDGIVGQTQGFDAASPVTATLSINASAYAFAAGGWGTAGQVNGLITPTYGYDQVYHSVSPGVNIVSVYAVSYVNDFLATSDYTASLDYELLQNDSGGGSFSIAVDNGGDSFGTLGVTHVTIAVLPAAVPEPASWAMMIGGLGLAGAALRVRRRRVLLQV